jgi:membrane fusion protein, multidrug efflux system
LTAAIAADRAAIETAQINLGYTKVFSPISGRIGHSTVTPGALVTANQDAALATITQLDRIYVDVSRSAATLLRLNRELSGGQIESAGDGAAKVTLKLEDGSTYPLSGKLPTRHARTFPAAAGAGDWGKSHAVKSRAIVTP